VVLTERVWIDTTGGSPQLSLVIGDSTVIADYVSGSTTNTLTFSYTIIDGQTDSDGISINANAFDANGAVLTDAVGRSLSDVSLSAVTANGSYKVDTTAPEITVDATSIALSADTGTDDGDLITNTASQTITASLSGGLASGDVLYGSVDSGTTWTDITTSVSGTSISWEDVTLSGSQALHFKVMDAAGNEGAVTTKAYVLDQTAPEISTSALAADENQTAIDDLASDDENAAWSLSGTDAASFSLSGGTLSFSSAPNYEVKSTYSVDITATDVAGNTSTQTVTVSVNDVNEAPTSTSIANATTLIDEVYTSDLTGYFSDQDANTTLIYTLAGDLPTGLSFSNGVITGTPTVSNETATLTVSASDSEFSSSQSFSLTILPPDQDAPEFQSSTAARLYDLWGYYSAVDSVSVYDANATDYSSLTYSLVSGNDAGHLAIDSASGEVTLDTDNIDTVSFKGQTAYDFTNGGYSFTVRATDAYGNFADQAVTVEVLARQLAMANTQIITGDITVSSTDTGTGFSLSYLSPSAVQAFQGDVHYFADEITDLSFSWIEVFSDGIDTVDESSTGVASPVDESFTNELSTGSLGEDVLRVGALTWDSEVPIDGALVTINVEQSSTDFPTWIQLDQVVLDADGDESDWSIDVYHNITGSNSVTGTGADEFFDVLGALSIATGAGNDVIGLNTFLHDHDVTVTDFLSGTDQLDFSGAMARMGYSSAEAYDGTAVLDQLDFEIRSWPIADISNLIAQVDSGAMDTSLLYDNTFVGAIDTVNNDLYVFVDTNKAVGVSEVQYMQWVLDASISASDIHVLNELSV